ncbi:Origin recognition complex subunit 3 [Oopsacas minuta]|uniref:Origin recognition complex subunit 3 n=1 Tax=Oopsacas minuta TaxID=111878 RepID=A0AAV7JQA5_9METZ|nr:Origin recognition complex subunit 3 [Oopsacas minuta]
MATSMTKGHFLYTPDPKTSRGKTSTSRRQMLSHKSNYYHYYLETVEEHINNIAKGSYTKMSERICNHLIVKLEEFDKRVYKLFPSIPTAAIISGINIADHEFMYEQLNESLANKISIASIVLNSRNCPNLKTCWKYIFTTLYKKLDLDTTGVDMSKLTARALNKLLTTNGEELRDTPLTLIIIFEEFEAMSDEVVNHVIMCVHQYVDTFPVAIIVNVAIFVSVLYDKLSWNASSILNVKEFELFSSFQLLTNIMNDLILTPNIPFVFTPDLLTWLYDQFSMYSMSINQFNHNLKVSLYYHMKTGGFLEYTFYENIDLDSAYFSKTWLIQYMAQMNNKEAGKSAVKRKGGLKIKEVTLHVQQLFDLYELAIGLAAALYQLLQVMGKEVQIFAKDYYSIYILLLKCDLLADDNFQGALKYIGSTLNQQLLADCVNVCQTELTHTLAKLQTESEKTSLGEIIDGLCCMQTKLESNKDNLPVSVKSEVVLAFNSLITDYFITRNPMKHPLAKLVFCELPKDMTMLVDPSILNSVHQDLSKPNSNIIGDVSRANLPPICIVYRLLNESGKFVNLYDWFQSYNFCNEEGGLEDDIDLVQAKFFSAVAELEFLGIIKPHKKKVDHVHKLTHGLLY